MATNKFRGECRCGSSVPAGAGSVAKVDGRWMVTCASCDGSASRARPDRVHDDVLLWPNGAGYTECTKEYAEACTASSIANARLREADETDEGYGALYEAASRADDRVAGLQADGHMGAPFKYDTVDPVQAQIGSLLHPAIF